MSDHPAALAHGPLEEVFPDVFFVTGTMRGEFFGSMWQFSRNMVVLREGGNLTLVNTVRLSDEGLADLDRLGKVTNVVRIGDMHGVDDRFYVDRYGARFWALPGMDVGDDLKVDVRLGEDGALPIHGCSLFRFEGTKRPEAILRLDREGGILIACDALQNWLAPDEFFDEETSRTMREMNFFTPAGVGLAWIHENDPQPEDFARLKQVPFRHVLCGHGVPLRDTAQEAFRATFQRLFGV